MAHRRSRGSRRSDRGTPLWLPLALLGAFAAGTISAPADALAAPFAGEGTAAIPEGGDRQKSRRQALERARRAALEAAIAEIAAQGATVDPAARDRVLAAASAWTSSYRILRQGDDGATATIQVEAELDLPRLEKLLAPAASASAPASGPPPPVLGEVQADGCPDELVGHVGDHLLARGLVAAAGDGPRLLVRLRCEPLGLVPQAQVHGARVRVKAGVPGDAGAEGEAIGFGGDPAAAASEGLRRALVGVGEGLHQGADSGIAITIEAPWPAARVRRVEKAIRDAVVGVRSVGVARIDPDGAVVLKIDASIDAEALAQRLRALTIPGAPLRVVGVDGPQRITATFAAEPPAVVGQP